MRRRILLPSFLKHQQQHTHRPVGRPATIAPSRTTRVEESESYYQSVTPSVTPTTVPLAESYTSVYVELEWLETAPTFAQRLVFVDAEHAEQNCTNPLLSTVNPH